MLNSAADDLARLNHDLIHIYHYGIHGLHYIFCLDFDEMEKVMNLKSYMSGYHDHVRETFQRQTNIFCELQD